MAYDQASSPQRTAQEGSRAIRLAVEREAITSGGWEDDVVDRVMAAHSDKITTNDGKVQGVKDAVAAYRAEKPDAFVTLSRVATNEKLPEHQRYAVSYREVLKARQRKQGLARAQSRGIRGTQRAAS
jgi:hypothetical protein